MTFFCTLQYCRLVSSSAFFKEFFRMSALWFSKFSLSLKNKKQKKTSSVLTAYCYVQKCQRKWLVRWIMCSNKIISFLTVVNCKTTQYENKPTARRHNTKFWFVVSLLTILRNECSFQQGWNNFIGHLDPWDFNSEESYNRLARLHGKVECYITDHIPVSCDEWREWEKCSLQCPSSFRRREIGNRNMSRLNLDLNPKARLTYNSRVLKKNPSHWA